MGRGSLVIAGVIAAAFAVTGASAAASPSSPIPPLDNLAPGAFLDAHQHVPITVVFVGLEEGMDPTGIDVSRFFGSQLQSAPIVDRTTRFYEQSGVTGARAFSARPHLRLHLPLGLRRRVLRGRVLRLPSVDRPRADPWRDDLPAGVLTESARRATYPRELHRRREGDRGVARVARRPASRRRHDEANCLPRQLVRTAGLRLPYIRIPRGASGMALPDGVHAGRADDRVRREPTGRSLRCAGPSGARVVLRRLRRARVPDGQLGARHRRLQRRRDRGGSDPAGMGVRDVALVSTVRQPVRRPGEASPLRRRRLAVRRRHRSTTLRSRSRSSPTTSRST